MSHADPGRSDSTAPGSGAFGHQAGLFEADQLRRTNEELKRELVRARELLANADRRASQLGRELHQANMAAKLAREAIEAVMQVGQRFAHAVHWRLHDMNKSWKHCREPLCLEARNNFLARARGGAEPGQTGARS